MIKIYQKTVKDTKLKKLEEFRRKASQYLALDGANNLTYLAPTRVNLDLAVERWPELNFAATREI